MWNDNDTHVDLIDFDYLTLGVERIISNDDLVPCTIGIYGDWGSGKSSLMRMVEKRLEQKDTVLTIKFNGWLFEGYEDAKTVLMGTILEEIIKKRTLGEKAKKLAVKLLKRVDWFKAAKMALKYGASLALLGPAGVGIAALSDIPKKLSEVDYESYIKENGSDDQETLRMGIREFHDDFADLLNETNITKLVVFIDDLDRCNPDTIIDTLEAIKLFLFVKKSAFIICADERLIKYAVRRRFPEIPGEASEVGRDYLEKLIQFPIRIPQLSSSEIQTYLNLLFTKLYVQQDEFESTRKSAISEKKKEYYNCLYNHETANKILRTVPPQLQEALLLSSQITPILTSGLNGNPRQCKRFLNTLLMRIEMAKSNGVILEIRVLSKMMLLEYFKPESFRKLSQLQNDQDGKPTEITYLEAQASKARENIEETIESKSKKGSTSALNIEPDLTLWLADKWLSKWLLLEPMLSSIDLRPYFYFSRDVLSTLSDAPKRMSTDAQEIYREMVSGSDLTLKTGLKKIEKISGADVSSIFSAIATKIREEEKPASRNKLIKALIELTGKREEMTTELFPFLESLPVQAIPPAVVPQLYAQIKSEKYKPKLEQIIRNWSTNQSNKPLAAAAQQRLSK
jgi:predicted KAP-like P-loop ATPase